MAVKLGTVQTFQNVKPDKAQALKVLEEAAEVFGAWQQWEDLYPDEKCEGFNAVCLMAECADVIQATCDLLAAYGVRDFTAYMEACRRRNTERGGGCDDMRVLIACEESQRVALAFRKLGHEAYSCDLEEAGGVTR